MDPLVGYPFGFAGIYFITLRAFSRYKRCCTSDYLQLSLLPVVLCNVHIAYEPLYDFKYQMHAPHAKTYTHQASIMFHQVVPKIAEYNT